jgi:hypothetical protein
VLPYPTMRSCTIIHACDLGFSTLCPSASPPLHLPQTACPTSSPCNSPTSSYLEQRKGGREYQVVCMLPYPTMRSCTFVHPCYLGFSALCPLPFIQPQTTCPTSSYLEQRKGGREHQVMYAQRLRLPHLWWVHHNGAALAAPRPCMVYGDYRQPEPC